MDFASPFTAMRTPSQANAIARQPHATAWSERGIGGLQGLDLEQFESLVAGIDLVGVRSARGRSLAGLRSGGCGACEGRRERGGACAGLRGGGGGLEGTRGVRFRPHEKINQTPWEKIDQPTS